MCMDKVREIKAKIAESKCPVVYKRPAQMKGLLAAQIRRNIFVALALAIVGPTTIYYSYIVPKKKAYAEYYEQTDMDALYDHMAKRGLMQSAAAASGGDDAA